MNITDRCVSLTYTSASEVQCGGGVMCMQTGLIPVISKESGVDVGDFGIVRSEESSRPSADSRRCQLVSSRRNAEDVVIRP